MKFNYLLVFICLAFISEAQQSADSKKPWDQLKPGMSDIQVQKLIGEPDKYENFTTVKNNTFDTSVYWRYHSGEVVVITNHLFDRIEKNREELLRSIQLSASKNNGLKIVPNGKK
jgi:hypothetical protein